MTINSEFRMLLLSEIVDIRRELKVIRESQVDASAYMLDKQVVYTKITDLYKKYQLKVPFSDEDTFFKFNENLKTNKFLQNNICILFKSCIDKDFVVTKSYLQMIRKFMAKELAMGFTATRQSRDKENPKDQMKPLEFFNIMEVVMTSAKEEKKLSFTKKDSVTSLSDVLSNAKSWDKTKN